MTEDTCANVSNSESMESADSSTAKQRKKRKWDQPAESAVADVLAVPGVLPMGNMGSVSGIAFAGVPLMPGGTYLTNPVSISSQTLPPMLQVPSLQQHAVALVQKLNQPKIQDELIAREIVINDAESAVRYKLTKRQTQEEIQKCTGAVVITRGKYRLPGAPLDNEKPLYLHISAGAHLETTVERIKAVDKAAAMVEEMLKQNFVNHRVEVGQPHSACVFLGFDADPSFNVAARIRGPNDQYVNHIMNETGATVFLKGRGAGVSETASGEEAAQPLHLFLSSNNPKSLEQAKILAENLLDTISAECGASRISSCKVYGAVPPPQQLLAGIPSSGNETKSNAIPVNGLTSSIAGSVPISEVSSPRLPGITSVLSQGTQLQLVGVNSPSQQDMVCYPQRSLTSGTSYSGYCGIYPQATPLQQVALALRQSTSHVASTVVPGPTAASSPSSSSMSSPSENEKRRPTRRKFQELPGAAKWTAPHHKTNAQESELLGLHKQGVRNISNMPAPQKLTQASSNGLPPPPPRTMPPPPPRTMPPPPPPPRDMPLPLPPNNVSSSPSTAMPPPPPKFKSSMPVSKAQGNKILDKLKTENVPDTLMKLAEYGDEDDDDQEESTEELLRSSSTGIQAAPKPFWAI